jgi:hypothetical protein
MAIAAMSNASSTELGTAARSNASGKPAFQVLSRPASKPQPVILTQRAMPHSASLQDWVEVVAAPLPDLGKGKQRANMNGITDEEEAAAASLVKDTDRIRLAYDSRGRRMVNQSVLNLEKPSSADYRPRFQNTDTSDLTRSVEALMVGFGFAKSWTQKRGSTPLFAP